jgi:transposase
MAWTVAIGVDTHKHAHVAVALDRNGTQLDSIEVTADEAGLLALVHWAQALGEPAFAIEGTGSYGAGLTRLLQAAGLELYECERPRRRERGRAKSDLLDAAAAARRLVAGERLARPRGGGPRQQLRLLLLERRSAQRARTAALNQLQAVVLTAPARLRERLRAASGETLARACARLRASGSGEHATTTAVLRRLAARAQTLEQELSAIDRELDQLIRALAPELLSERGVGPVCAAQLVVSTGDPNRMRSDASFAALAGTSPVEASSGQVKRHRLSRGGDRQLNWALHLIAIQRIRHDPETRDYYTRLLASGKSKREALRCLKRALARRLYHLLAANPALAPH